MGAFMLFPWPVNILLFSFTCHTIALNLTVKGFGEGIIQSSCLSWGCSEDAFCLLPLDELTVAQQLCLPVQKPHLQARNQVFNNLSPWCPVEVDRNVSDSLFCVFNQKLLGTFSDYFIRSQTSLRQILPGTKINHSENKDKIKTFNLALHIFTTVSCLYARGHLQNIQLPF